MRPLLPFLLLAWASPSAQPRVDYDARNAVDANGTFYLVFLARESPGATGLPGHAYVAFLAEDHRARMSVQDASGFTCDGEDTCASSFNAPMPGRMQREAMGRGAPSQTARFVVQVNQRAYDQARRVQARWSRGGSYSLLQRDCITYASDVARAAGLRRASGNFVLPSGYVRALRRANR